jgi:hypothetical protein
LQVVLKKRVKVLKVEIVEDSEETLENLVKKRQIALLGLNALKHELSETEQCVMGGITHMDDLEVQGVTAGRVFILDEYLPT